VNTESEVKSVAHQSCARIYLANQFQLKRNVTRQPKWT